VLGAELSTGHEVGLIVVAAVFIAFALAASFLVPRYKPDFPGPAGIGVFAIASIVLFGLMIAAVYFFG
jgi:membrane associated rhomboid family serine protease